MVSYLRPFLASVRVSFRMFAVEMPPLFYLGTEIPNLVMRTVFFFLIARCAGGPHLGQFALIGNAVLAINLAIMMPVSNVVYMERTTGNLELLMVTPANKVVTILGRAGASFVEGLLKTFTVLLLMGPIAGVPLTMTVGALRALPVLFLISVSMTGFALAVASASFTMRVEFILASVSGSVLMILGGVNVPLEALPSPLAAVGKWLPLTHGLLAFRAIAEGASYSDVLPHVLSEAWVGAAYMFVGVFLFSMQLLRARRSGIGFT
ncbi:MAG: ABC transporter permease [Bacteroidota bacterium]